MISGQILVFQGLHLLAAVAVGALVLAAYRHVRTRSAAIGWILAAGIVARAVAGVTLFWASYLGLPLGRSMQLGRGFWQVAIDATGYYDAATGALESGRLLPLDHAVAAPFFVDTFAVWMMAVGASPASGMYLNLCLYAALVVIVVRSYRPADDWRQDLPCVVCVAAYSFAPVILFHSTQPLKDELSSFLVGLACVAVVMLRAVGRAVPARDWRTAAAGAMVAGAAILGMAGVRWYFGFLLMGCLGIALVGGLFRGELRRWRYAVASVAVLAVALLAFRAGAGPYYEVTIGANLRRIVAWDPPRSLAPSEVARSGRALIERVEAVPADLGNMAQMSRTGFLGSGGNTNIVVPLHDDEAAGAMRARELTREQHESAVYQARLRRMRGEGALEESQADLEPPLVAGAAAAATPDPMTVKVMRAVPVTRAEQVEAVITGLGIVFVPLSVMTALTGTAVSGGRGLLYLADLDTVFLDVSLIAMAVLLWQRRRVITNSSMTFTFNLMAAGTTAVLLGYVVTNFGTLWRMRPLVMVPLWLLALTLAPRRTGQAQAADEPQARAVQRVPDASRA